ncbi:MAG: hypothetical protein E7E45_26225, partial [Klebsiella pneumoniae]|nr:hypothetical protein [Klebsiella pneumoniae]
QGGCFIISYAQDAIPAACGSGRNGGVENRERERRYYPVSYHDDNVLIGKVGDKHGIFQTERGLPPRG